MNVMNLPLVKFRPPTLGLVLCGLALACWPVFRWWVARMTDGSDDPLGVAALVVAGYFLWERRSELTANPYGAWMAMGVILTQGVLPLPPLVRAGCLVLALSLALDLIRCHSGIVLLLLLSLPVVASLQFYFGYPLRLITAEISRWLLELLQVSTERSGTLLRWREHTVGVDAACSGVKLLWATGFLVGALAARENLSWTRAGKLALVGLALVIALNGVRSTLLFFPEAHLVEWPEWTHEAVGVGLFVMVAGTLVLLANRLTQRAKPRVARVATPWEPLTTLVWICAMVVSAGLACFFSATAPAEAKRETITWPTYFEGERLTPVPLSDAEERFAAHFPGQISVFTSASGRTIIFRHINRASREVHSSADCLQSAGYVMHPEPQFQDDQGRAWGQYTAEGNGPIRRVRETITDRNGVSFTDPSAWFWPALLGQSNGPWTAITAMER